MKKIVILIAAQVVILGGALGAAWYLFKGPGDAAPAEAGEAVVEAPAKDPLYRSLEPAFVVNMADGRSVRFLQVQVDLMTRKPSVIERLEKYDLRIRNDLVMLFSSVTRDDISTPEGRLKLQADALATVNGVLEQETGSGGVEAVYFTKFVMQ